MPRPAAPLATGVQRPNRSSERRLPRLGPHRRSAPLRWVDGRTQAQLAGVVRQLVICANEGRVGDGFRLYSLDFRERFRVQLDLSEEAFARTFVDVSPRPRDEWTSVAAIRRIRRETDGRATAVVWYGQRSADEAPVVERYRFARSGGGRWLIDDIEPINVRRQVADRAASGVDEPGSNAVAENRREGHLGRPGRTRSMLANSVALIGGKLATMGLGFLAWLVAARLFAQDDVGLASSAVSAMMLGVQLALFGVGAAIITLFPKHETDPADLLDTSLTAAALASLLIASGFLALAAGFFPELGAIATRPGASVAFVVMCVAGTLGVLFDQLSTAQRRGDLALARGVVSGLATLGAVAALPLGFGAASAGAILLAWAVGNLAPVVLGYAQLRRTIVGYRYRPRLSRRLVRRMVGLGLPNWLLTLTERAPGAVLPIVVTELLSPQANAAWYAAWMMAWVVYVVPIQVGLNLFAEAAHAPTNLRGVLRHGIRTSLAIGLAAALAAAVVGPHLLGVLGAGYAEQGATPLRILVAAVLPYAFVQAYFSACRAQQRFREAIAVGVIGAAGGITAAAGVGLAFGLSGMAVAWLATQTALGLWALARLRSFDSSPASDDQAIVAKSTDRDDPATIRAAALP